MVGSTEPVQPGSDVFANCPIVLQDRGLDFLEAAIGGNRADT